MNTRLDVTDAWCHTVQVNEVYNIVWRIVKVCEDVGQVEECGCCLNVFGGEEGVTVAESNSVSILGGESLIKLD